MSADENLEATFCFVDIAGYTALTESHGELAAADLIDEFTRLVTRAFAPSGEVVEIMGDCAFAVFPQPAAALAAVTGLYDLIADRRDFPLVRAGLHHGPALLRDGRYFGSTVNVAARMAELAVGGHVMATGAVVAGLGDSTADAVDVRHRGAMRLKNVAHAVDVYEVIVTATPRQFVIDPVCKMQVDRARAAGQLEFRGETYWFCSLACAEAFAREPTVYAPVQEHEDDRPDDADVHTDS